MNRPALAFRMVAVAARRAAAAFEAAREWMQQLEQLEKQVTPREAYRRAMEAAGLDPDGRPLEVEEQLALRSAAHRGEPPHTGAKPVRVRVYPAEIAGERRAK